MSELKNANIYILTKDGNIECFESIENCLSKLNISQSTFYRYYKSNKPLKMSYFLGYDKNEVEDRAKDFWGYKKSIDNIRLQKLEEHVMQLTQDIESLKSQHKHETDKLKKEIENLKRQLSRQTTTPTKAETRVESVTQELKQKDKVEAKKEVSKPIEQQATMPVNANKLAEGTIVPASEVPTPKKHRPDPEKDGYLWNWTNETYKVWYKNSIDQQYHLRYCPGYDLMDEWNVSDEKPFCYLPNGEVFDYRTRNDSDENKKKWAIISDEKNGCPRFIQEKEKFGLYFKDYIKTTGRHIGFVNNSVETFPSPVYEATEHKGVFKVYDPADLFVARASIHYNDGFTVNTNIHSLPLSNVFYRIYKESAESTSIGFKDKLTTRDYNVLRAFGFGEEDNTLYITDNGSITEVMKLNEEVEKYNEREVDL